MRKLKHFLCIIGIHRGNWTALRWFNGKPVQACLDCGTIKVVEA